MAISSFHNGRTVTTITGSDGMNRVDVDLVSGKRRMATDAVVTVEQLFGRPGFAAAWFAIGDFDDCDGVGAAGDEIRIQIAAGCDPTEFPAIDLTYTIQASDVAAAFPEIEVRDNIIIMLNGDADFKSMWLAKDVKDNGIVFIESKFRAETGDRTIVGDFAVTPTGTTRTTIAFNVVLRRGTETELVRSIDDPRQGILGITGSITIAPGALSNRIEVDLLDGVNNDMSVNGSGTPAAFRIEADPVFDLFFTQIRIHGADNGIKFGNFLGLNSALANGIQFDIKSDDLPVDIDPIHTTDDIKARFSSIGGFELDIQAGGDHVLGSLDFGFVTPIVIRAQGTFALDDYIEVSVNDNLSSITNLFTTVLGFKREP